MNTSIKAGRRSRTSLRSVAMAFWAVVAGVNAQTAPIGTSRPAEYDCSGLAGVALTSCRQLNADAVKGATLRNDAPPNATHDCSGMTGGALATCRDLNGAPAAATPGVAGAGGAYGGVPSIPAGSQVVPPSQPVEGTRASTATQTTTPTTGGTGAVPSNGTGTITFSDGTTVIIPSGPGASMTTVPSATLRNAAPLNGGRMTSAPGQVSPPSDVVTPMGGASGTSAPAGAAPAADGGRSVK